MLSPDYFADIVNHFLPEPHSALLNGIILGVPIRSSSAFYRELRNTGLIHLVVLSGSNIAILNSFIGLISSHFSKLVSIVIVLLTIIFFIAFVSPQAPIVRAALMLSFTSVAFIYGKRSSALLGLLVASILIAWVFPDWVSSLSFQLSVAATLGIILFGRTRPGSHWIAQELRLTLAAQVFTTPLIFIKFKTISLISPVANIAVAWTVGPLMLLGFILAIFGKIFYPIAIIASVIAYGILSFFITVVHLLNQLPYSSIYIP